MIERVDVKIQLSCYVRREADHWLSVCPRLDVASQGDSEQQAMDAIHEALGLWFESCLDRGVLDQALSELGFRRGAGDLGDGDEGIGIKRITKRRPARRGSDILGKNFPVELTVPAYQAAIFGSSTSARPN